MSPEQSYLKVLDKNNVTSMADLKVDSVGETLYAVILDFKPIRRANHGTKDFSRTVTLSDPTLKGQTISLVVFKKKEEALPKVEKGRFMILKHFRVNAFNNRRQILGTQETTYLTFDPSTLDTFTSNTIDCQVQEGDKEVIAALKAFYSSSAVPTPKPLRRPVLETAELMDASAKYFDFVGMVVGYYPEQGRRKTNLALTDYTINPKPYLTDDDGVRGIRCNLLVQCTLWDNHSDHCPKLQFGDFVYLSNCVLNTRSSTCEISVRGNREQKNQLTKLSEDDVVLSKLIERRSKYTPIPMGSVVPIASQDDPMIVDTDPIRTRILNLDSIITIRDILEKEETGLFYTRAFIEDYKPKDLNKWLRSWCSGCQRTFENPKTPCPLCKKATEVIYQFCLLLQDNEGSVLIVYGFEADADMLFSEIPAKKANIDQSSFERLEKIMKLACNKNEKVYLDFGIRSYDTKAHGRNYRISNTEFVMEDE